MFHQLHLWSVHYLFALQLKAFSFFTCVGHSTAYILFFSYILLGVQKMVISSVLVIEFGRTGTDTLPKVSESLFKILLYFLPNPTTQDNFHIYLLFFNNILLIAQKVRDVQLSYYVIVLQTNYSSAVFDSDLVPIKWKI